MTAASRYLARWAEQSGASEVEVVPFGIDTSRFYAADSNPHRPFTIGAVKALRAKYGTRTLIEALEEAVDSQRAVFGDNHPRLAEIYNLMGDVRREEGRYAEAEALHAKALTVCGQLGGRESPEGARSLWAMGQARWRGGDLDGAPLGQGRLQELDGADGFGDGRRSRRGRRRRWG